MIMSKEEKKVAEAFEISMTGLLSCDAITPKKETDALKRSLKQLDARLKRLEEGLGKLEKSLGIISTRLERIEGFLRSFR